jgi:hypothetical protein
MLALALVGLTLVAGAQGSAEQAARQGKKCKSLRGRDLAPARSVKLVKRKTADGNDLLGCVLPHGRVHKVASYEDLFTTVYSYRVRQVARAFVLLDESYSSQYGASSSTSVFNLRTGKYYVIASDCATIGSPGPCNPSDATAPAAFINRRGQAAAAISKAFANLTTIAAFSSKGVRRELDSGPPSQLPAASLRLSGNTISWMHSGAARSAPLVAASR